MSSLFARAYGNSVVLAHSRGQRRVPYLAASEIASRRDGRIQKVARYASRTVPHYRELFKSLGIDPHEIRTADDLDRLPLVSKAELGKAPKRFVSESRRGCRAVPFDTSGTTGLRLRIEHDRHSLLANIAFSERERALVTAAVGKTIGYRELALGYAGNTLNKVTAYYRAHTYLPVRPDRRFVAVDQPVEEVVQAINDHQPDVLLGYGSYLEALYRLVAVSSIRLHRPKLVFYVAEAMSPEGVEFIEQKFELPVYSRYNAVEAFKIGFSCEMSRGFHLHDDLCHVRIVDSAGHDLPAGETGEVVISNLVNHGTVLLNYRLGDLGRLARKTCPCGRNLRMLEDLQGRVEEVLYLSEERFVHPRAVWGVLKKAPDILRYQLIQHERERFELRLLTIDEAAFDCVRQQVLGPLEALLEPAVIEPVRLEGLGPQEAGKFRPVIAMGPPT